MFATEIFIILILLLINAFFALSEMAVVSSSKPMLRQMALQGNKRAAMALKIAEDPGAFLSTVQIGITLVGILAGAYGGANIADKLAIILNEYSFVNPHGQSLAVALVVGSITYFSVVMGELVPKQFALNNSEKVAMLIAPFMLMLSKICLPLVKVLDLSAELLMKMMGVLKKDDERISEAEMKAVIAEGVQHGTIERSEHEMFQRIIRLGDRDVKTIMTHRVDVEFIDVNDSIEEIRQKIHNSGHSRYPVVSGNANKILGIVQAKQMLDGALSNKEINIKDYIQEVQILPDNTSCLGALDMFKSNPVNMAIVIDEYGATEGLITLSDLMEAIVGVLPSNYDEGEDAQIIIREDGSWLVDGMVAVEELNVTSGLEAIEPSNSYDTLAGLILYTLNRTPVEGDVFESRGYRFEILDMDGKRIDKVLITKLPVEDFGI
jgi:putative hemolysin